MKSNKKDPLKIKIAQGKSKVSHERFLLKVSLFLMH